MASTSPTSFPTRVYYFLITALGLGITAVLLYQDRAAFLDRGELQVLAFFLFASVLASMAPVPTASGVVITVGLAPMFGALLALPAGLATVTAVLGTIDRRRPGRDISWRAFFFNRGMFGIMYGTATFAFTNLRTLEAGSTGLISAALVALVVIVATNSVLLVVAVTLYTGQSMAKVAYGSLGSSLLSYAGLAPIGVLMAYVIRANQAISFLMAGVVFILLLVYRELARQALRVRRVAQGSYVAQSRLVDKKDGATFGHSERVGILSEAVANRMNLPIDLIEQIKIGATLHDLGKIAIPDAILHKPGKLTDEEWAIMKTHPVEGYDVLQEQEVLAPAASIVRAHHENFDGTGYPDALAGRAIPVGGRIARVVDSFDAMTQERAYRDTNKEPFEALSELSALAGRFYDPEVVDAFTEVILERTPLLAAQILGPNASAKPPLTAPLRHRNFAALWVGQGLSNFGDMLTTVGLALFAYGYSHQAWPVAAIFAARALPNLLFGLFAGDLADRYDRKLLMVAMDVLRALMVAAVPILIHSNFAALIAITFAVSTATVVFNPAKQATIPDILPPGLLQQGNSLTAISERLTEIAGFLAATFVLGGQGLPVVFAIDALTFITSAGIILTLPFPDIIRSHEAISFKTVRQNVAAGVRYIGGVAELRIIFIYSFFIVVMASALQPLIVPLALQHIKGGTQQAFPLLEMSIAVGAAAGALIGGVMRPRSRGNLMLIGTLGMGIATVFAGYLNQLPLTMIFLAAGGVANLVYFIPMITAIQEVTDRQFMGRVMAARFTLVQVGVLFGTVYAGLITALVPVGMAVVISGAIIILVTFLSASSTALHKV